MMINNNFEAPYNKFAPEGSIPILSKTLVKSRLSQKFWKVTEKIYQDIEIQKRGEIMESQKMSEPLSYSNHPSQMPNNKTRMQENEKVNTHPVNTKLRAKSNVKKSAQEDTGILSQPTTNEEIESMKLLIQKLQNDIEKKDEIIRRQKAEKERLMIRMDDLEKMLSSFLVS